MKYIFIALLGLCTCACTNLMHPNHLGITPSFEWEVQDHQDTKLKPKIAATMDWNF